MKNQKNIGIIGLGYVGLPLAVAFSKKFSVIGFDIQSSRVRQLQQGIDKTLEVDSKDLKKNKLVQEVVNFLEKDKKRPICTPFSK